MFPRLLSLFVLALTSLSSRADEVVSIYYAESNKTRCLGVPSPVDADFPEDSTVAIYNCSGDRGQLWRLSPHRAGIPRVILDSTVTTDNTRCLSVTGDPAIGRQILLETCLKDNILDGQNWVYAPDTKQFQLYQNMTRPGDYCMSLENDKAQIAWCDKNEPRQKWDLPLE